MHNRGKTMSYAMTHLIIANEFAKKRNIENKDIFLLGSIAPDAVHARKNFTPDMKAKSHFMLDGMKWGQVYEEVPMSKWYSHLKEIYDERIVNARNDKDVAFLQGYTIHLLTDVFNCQILYAPNLIKYNLEVDRLRNDYRRECIEQDAFLYQNYPESKIILDALKRAMTNDLREDMIERLDLNGHISAQNVVDNTKFQFGTFLNYGPASLDKLAMVSKERTEFFLNHVLSECERMLFDFPECERTFKMN